METRLKEEKITKRILKIINLKRVGKCNEITARKLLKLSIELSLNKWMKNHQRVRELQGVSFIGRDGWWGMLSDLLMMVLQPKQLAKLWAFMPMVLGYYCQEGWGRLGWLFSLQSMHYLGWNVSHRTALYIGLTEWAST